MSQEQYSNGTLRVFKRLNFFKGFFTTAEDWNEGQEYHLRKRLFHNRHLHTKGILSGIGEDLQVVPHDEQDIGEDGSTNLLLTVKPGAALDGLGNEILLHEERTVAIPVPASLPHTRYLIICYGEKKTDYFKNFENDAYSGHTRWTEEPQLAVSGTAPGPAEVELARFRLEPGVTGLKDPADPANPQGNEIDRTHVARAGAVDETRDRLLRELKERIERVRETLYDRHRLVNRGLHTPGIMPLIEKQLAVVAAGGMFVQIKPGAALDGHGREIELGEALIVEVKPQALQPVDDLKRIKGIGPVFEKRLNEKGIYTFAALAEELQRPPDPAERWMALVDIRSWQVHTDDPEPKAELDSPIDILNQALDLAAEVARTAGEGTAVRQMKMVAAQLVYIVLRSQEDAQAVTNAQVTATAVAPDGFTTLELARIHLQPGVTEIRNPADPQNPVGNEIDRRYAHWAGSVALPQLPPSLQSELGQLLRDTRRAFGELDRIFDAPSAADVRHAALDVEVLVRNGSLRPERLAGILSVVASVEQDVGQELRQNHTEIHGRQEFVVFERAANELVAVVGAAVDHRTLIAHQRAVTDAARELSQVEIRRPAASARSEGIVYVSGDMATVRLDASDSQAYHGESIVRYIWEKQS